jgi:hypothetical protein
VVGAGVVAGAVVEVGVEVGALGEVAVSSFNGVALVFLALAVFLTDLFTLCRLLLCLSFDLTLL